MLVVVMALATLPTIAFGEGEARYGIVTASLLNLREGANTSSRILAQIPKGATVSVNSINGNWAHATYLGKAGYLCMDYLKIMAGENPSRNQAVSSKGQAVVELAKQFLGTPYRYGGSSPPRCV